MSDALWSNVGAGISLAVQLFAVCLGVIYLVIGVVRLVGWAMSRVIKRSGTSGRQEPKRIRHGWVFLVATLMVSIHLNTVSDNSYLFRPPGYFMIVNALLVIFFVVIVIGLLTSAVRQHKRRIDFDTESADSERASLPSGSSPRATVGGSGEFDLSDPLGSFISTIWGVVARPVGFFAGMARQRDFLNPLIFGVICALIYQILFFYQLLFSFVSPHIGTTSRGVLISSGVIFIFLYVILTMIVLFVGAAICHVLVLLLVRSNAGFEATFRVLAYTSVTLLVGWLAKIPLLISSNPDAAVPVLLVDWLAKIPRLEILIGLVVGTYGIVLGIIGIREAHSTTTGRAAAVVLIPALVVVLGWGSLSLL